jgi:cation diffusion facilitator CzcD-associated flavoprotein CzcO
VLDEWDWTEHFSPQPETLKYIQYLATKFDLKRDMQFNTEIRSAHFNQERDSWILTDTNEVSYSSRYLITCMGILNKPTLPNIPGSDTFMGESCHTARWTADTNAFDGKRVGVIGTGATGIQTMQTIAPNIGHLTVFQRTPNWTGPLRNTKITKEEMKDIRARYPELFKRCMNSYSGFIHVSDSRPTMSIPEDERLEIWEKLYSERGFGKVLSVSSDIATNREANALYSEFMANKIRERVKNPITAELLIPKNHGFGTRRPPLESGYYEIFNQSNVELVDINANPIERIEPKGIRTKDGLVELDVIIYATGFNAVTGSFDTVDFQGKNGTKLKDVWSNGIRTFLGLTVQDFPNMFMVMGPHQMFGNIPRSIEYAVDWIADAIEYFSQNNITHVEATEQGMDKWTEHVHQCGEGLLANEVDSWMTGVNKNVAGKQQRSMTRYNGPGSGFRDRCNAVKNRQYSDFVLRRHQKSDKSCKDGQITASL